MPNKKMTVEQLISFIEKDIKNLKKERAEIAPESPTTKNETMRNYLAARQNTLSEILSYIK